MNSTHPSANFDDAIAILAEGRHGEAEALMRAIVARGPVDQRQSAILARLIYNRGVETFAREGIAGAEPLLREAQAMAPTLPELRRGLAEVLARRGLDHAGKQEWTEAIRAAGEACALLPDLGATLGVPAAALAQRLQEGGVGCAGKEPVLACRLLLAAWTIAPLQGGNYATTRSVFVHLGTGELGMPVAAEIFEALLMGKEDGIPKTPEWAAKKCGVAEWTIKALARSFAKDITSIAHYFGGGMIRGPYSHEPARLEVCLLGMQGLGKPGVHQLQLTYFGMPRAEGVSGSIWNSEMLDRITIPVMSSIANWQESSIPKTLIDKYLASDEPLKFNGTGAIEAPIANQFKEYQFPLPGEPSIRMMWTDAPCRTTCWNGGNTTEDGLRSPKLECIIAQHPWLENDCLFADIILPANTHMEVDDIVTNLRQGGTFANMMLCEKAIEPVGESMSDPEIVIEIAKKLGLEEQVTEGFTTEQVREKVFESMGLNKVMTWEEFKEKKYHLYQAAEDWKEDSPGFRKFADDPVKFPLGTPSRKLEFYSERLAKHFPEDKERPPSPQWIENSEMHDERLSSPRAKEYSLLLMSNHGRWRTHAQCDDITWTREAPTCKIMGPDGYAYEPIWIHTSEAEKRGIRHGEIIKIFNERGIVLGGAYVTERMRPGVAYIDHGARIDPIIRGKVDRGGAINTIAPTGTISKNCVGQATSGYLVEVAKIKPDEWEEWRTANPWAFQRPYDAGAGLRFEAWVERPGGER